MKRPLAFTGFCFSLSLAVVCLFAGVMRAALTALVFLCLVFVVICRKTRKSKLIVAGALACFLGCLIFTLTSYIRDCAEDSLQSTTREVELTVLSVSQYADSSLVNARIERADSSAVYKIEAEFFIEQTVQVGERAKATLKFGTLESAARSGATTFETDCVFYKAVGYDPLLRFSMNARELLAQRLSLALSGDELGLCSSILTGDKDALSTDARLNLRDSGVSHIVVVSGLHITLLLGIFWQAMKKLRFPSILSFVVMLALCVLCVAVFGATPSVLRACIMAALAFTADCFARDYDPITALACAMTLILFFDPLSVYEPSFVLSFCCCTAITAVYPTLAAAIDTRFEESGAFVKRVLSPVLKALVMSGTISALTLPAAMLFGFDVSLVSPFTNLLVVPFVAPVMICSLLCAAFSALPLFEPMFLLCGLLAGICSKIILTLTAFFSSFGFASVPADALYLKLWVVVCAAVLFARKRLNARLRTVLLCAVLTLIIGAGSAFLLTFGRDSVSVNERAVIAKSAGRSLVIAENASDSSLVYLKRELKSRFIDEPDYVIIDEVNDEQELGKVREALGTNGVYSLEELKSDAARHSTPLMLFCGAERVYFDRSGGVLFCEGTGALLLDGQTVILSGTDGASTLLPASVPTLLCRNFTAAGVVTAYFEREENCKAVYEKCCV